MEITEKELQAAIGILEHSFWCVCWFGEVEDEGFVQHKGPPVFKEEAERRMAKGMKMYPQIIYWIERA